MCVWGVYVCSLCTVVTLMPDPPVLCSFHQCFSQKLMLCGSLNIQYALQFTVSNLSVIVQLS